jgi:hypothetical protein
MFSDLLKRNSRRRLLIEINPYQVLVAGTSRSERGGLVLDCAAEFDLEDQAGLREWLDANFDKRKSWMPAVCGLVSPDGLLQRESIQPRRLNEPDYLTNLVREQYKVEHPEAWKFQALSPVEGLPLTPDGTARPALICGMANHEVHHVQQRLLDNRLMPERLEPGLLPLLGVISDRKARRNDKRAAVIVIIEREHTVAYILGKEGVHTPNPVSHGFTSIMQSAAKEFELTDEAEIHGRLHQADDEVLLRATKFVRAIGRDLKPVIDSYEMTTGQPVGEIYCAYLPPTLAWMAEPLALVMGRTSFTVDCRDWMATVGLQAAAGLPEFGTHWLGALSLIAELPGQKADDAPGEGEPSQRPWHMDCRISAELPSNQLVGRRFLTGTIAATLAVLACTVTVWQLYVSKSLRADTVYWEEQMGANEKLFAELNHDNRTLSERSARLDSAYDLMAAPYAVSDFVINLGRTLPPHMRINRIDANDTRVALSGGLREPSEEASRTLGRYLDELRRAPAIGPLFSNIGLTALQRDEDSDTLSFEITFKLKNAQP